MWTVSEWYDAGRAAGARDHDIIRNFAELRLGLLKEQGPEACHELTRRLVGFHRERMDAVPDLSTYPELRGMRELVLAEQKGISEAAELDEVMAAAYFTGFTFYHRFVAGSPAPGATQVGKANCSCIFFPASDCGPLFGNNLDSTPRQKFGTPAWPACNEHLVIGGVSSGVFMDEHSPEIFPAPVSRLVERYCRSAREAVELYTRYNLFWGPCNLIVADRRREVAMIEKSACRIGVRWSPDGFGFVTAMTAAEPGMNAYLADRRAASVRHRNLPPGNADEAYWRNQDRRRELMDDLLDEARKQPTFEAMRRILQFRDPVRGNVCGFGDPIMPGGPESEYTLRTIIWKLRDARACWWAQRGHTPSWEHPRADVTFRDVLRWE